LKVTCGIDWSEKHHDIALVDADGQLVARKRVTDDAAGWETLLDLFATYGDSPGAQIPVVIETGRGCWSPVCAPPAARSTRSIRWQ
jgi:hypothetical protein